MKRLLLRAKAKTALEIGAGPCGTAVMMVELGMRVVSVDLPEKDGGTPASYEGAAKEAAGDKWTLIRGRSTAYDTVDKVVNLLTDVDFLLIDAEHTEAAALADYETYRFLLTENGITAFHDITCGELWPMWNRLRGQRPPDRSVEIIRDVAQRGCGLGVLLGR